MTPESYGAISVIVSGSALFGVVLGSAFESAVFRWSARSEPESRDVLRFAAVHIYMVVPLLSLAAATVLWFQDETFLSVPSRMWAIEVLANGLIPAMSFYALPRARALNNLRRFVILSGSSILILTLGKVLFVIVFTGGLLGWVLSDLVAAAFGFLLAFLTYRPPTRRRGLAGVRRQLLGYVLPLIPHRTAFWALSSLSRPAMTLSIPLAQIGLFSAAFNFASIASIVLVELNRAFLTEYSKERFPAPSNLTRRVVRVQMLASIAVPGIVGASLSVAAPFLLSTSFQSAEPIVALLLIAQIAYGIYLVPTNYVVQTAGLTGLSWIASVAGALVIFVVILVAGETIGIKGVGLATVGGYVVMAILAFVLLSRHRLEVDWSQIGLPISAVLFCCVGASVSLLSLLLPFDMYRIGWAFLSLILIAVGLSLSRRSLFNS